MTQPAISGPGGPILVIGGDGFLGRVVCRTLRGAGLKVVAADIASSEGTAAQGSVISLDVADRKAVFETVGSIRPSQIINLSYVVGPALAANPGRAVAVNLSGQINCLDAVLETGVRRYLHAGSIGAYGPSQDYYGDREIAEEDGCPPPHHTELYGAMKAFDEVLIAQYASRIEVCGFRFSVIFGPGRRHGFTKWTSALCERPEPGTSIEIPLSPEQRISLISDEDAARLFLLAVEADTLPARILNSGGHDMSGKDIRQYLNRMTPGLSVALRDRPGPLPFAHRFSNALAQSVLGFSLTPLDVNQGAAGGARKSF
ncbi:NAD-dependent epimerase/dehydratase family protein [Nitratireductor sp. GCM10026969]|uniref:NAD-dependent epimerase/dehydratase family protein n=1 Tax=Nitratireductor sp. GCM10026969 TaxID=3252645 RepID=UPI0036113127